MRGYRIPMVPGPTSVPAEVLSAYQHDYASADLEEEYSAPTVTAVKVPEAIGWEELDRRLRGRGVAVGGNYGPLAGKIIRLGHMGSQANENLVDQALEALRDAIG